MTVMNDNADDDIDVLLLASFEGPVPAGDFCQQVMERLPARRRRFPWAVAAGLTAGVAVCGVSLSAAPLARTGWRDWLSGDLSAPAVIVMLAAVVLAVLASAWTMAESADR